MKTKLYIGIMGLIALASCKKLDVENPDFEVTTEKTTYKVGEVVNFQFTGNPDLITVYRGIAGENYDFRARTSAEGIPQLNFTTLIQNTGQVNTLRLMASTDFQENMMQQELPPPHGPILLPGQPYLQEQIIRHRVRSICLI